MSRRSLFFWGLFFIVLAITLAILCFGCARQEPMRHYLIGGMHYVSVPGQLMINVTRDSAEVEALRMKNVISQICSYPYTAYSDTVKPKPQRKPRARSRGRAIVDQD